MAVRYFQPTDYFLSGGEAEEAEVERAPGGHGHLARLWGSVSAAEELQETCGAAGAQHFSLVRDARGSTHGMGPEIQD